LVTAYGDTHQWNTVKTHGIKNAETMILKSTFSTKEKKYQYASAAGTPSQTLTWSGREAWKNSA